MEPSAGIVGRFAPSTTGRAHPGTLLAALLCWLDARSRGGRVVLRLEDLDPDRSSPAFVAGLADDCAWFGLDWDLEQRQSDALDRHAAALDRLHEAGLLYPCRCSRRMIRARCHRAPDGGFIYDGHCRHRDLPTGGWRACHEAVRCRMPAEPLVVRDETGAELGGSLAASAGDPVLRRRDGAMAYHLASVVDDAAVGVTRVVRGRDLAPSTLVQVALQQLLGLPRPVYRHHLLLLQPDGDKLAKFHGAVAADTLRHHYQAPELCGLLAACCGLRPTAAPLWPADLVADFAWDRVSPTDQILSWDGQQVSHQGAADA